MATDAKSSAANGALSGARKIVEQPPGGSMSAAIPWTFDDGGRKAAGFEGRAGDCVVRATSIATGIPYCEAYKTFYVLAKDPPRRYTEKTKARLRANASPRKGVSERLWRPFYEDIGWIWVPTKEFGQPTRVHLKADELPGGTIICRLSKHLCAVINGVLHDTYDSSWSRSCQEYGKRTVYGYFKPGVYDHERDFG
jgi:hypothetical protein